MRTAAFGQGAGPMPSLRPGTNSGASLRLAGNQLAGLGPDDAHDLENTAAARAAVRTHP